MKKAVKKKKSGGAEKKPFISNKALVQILVLLGILLLIYVAYALLSSLKEEKSYEYNGYEFVLSQDGFWRIPLQAWYGERYFFFYNHPSDVEGYDYDPRVNTYLAIVHRNSGGVVIALDPEYAHEPAGSMASVEVAKITSQIFGMPTTAAYTSPIPGEDDLPIVNCNNASEELFVLNVRLNGNNSVGIERDFCAALYAETPRDAVNLASLFVYKNLGIMK